MFKLRHAATSAIGPIVTRLGRMIKAPLRYQMSLFSYVRNNQNPEYKFALKYYKEPP